MATRQPFGDPHRILGAAEVALAAGLIALAWLLDRGWFDRHVLPNIFVPRQTQWRLACAARLCLAAAGLVLALVAKRLAVASDPLRVLRGAGLVLAATVAGLLTAELALRLVPWTPFQAWQITREPRRMADPALGWRHLPRHSGRDRVGGRWIDYAFDDRGYRVARPGERIDPAAPSVLFIGESIMLGFGLAWSESIPGRVQRASGEQSANLAVTGYSTDQAVMRLRQELPRFAHPTAVVAIYLPGLLDRDINTDRPHLDTRLVWRPPQIGSRIGALLRHALSLRSESEIGGGVDRSAAFLRAGRDLARSRCARFLVLSPSFPPEDPMETAIRDKVMSAAGVTPIVLPLAPSWRIPGDLHPDARAAQAMAGAIIAHLRSTEAAPCRT